MDDRSDGYRELGERVGALVSEKQAQYGDSFSRSGLILRVLYPNGISPDALDDALVVVRIIDKLFRIATAMGGPDRGGESPWRDIAGYALLAMRRVIVATTEGDRHEEEAAT